MDGKGELGMCEMSGDAEESAVTGIPPEQYSLLYMRQIQARSPTSNVMAIRDVPFHLLYVTTYIEH